MRLLDRVWGWPPVYLNKNAIGCTLRAILGGSPITHCYHAGPFRGWKREANIGLKNLLEPFARFWQRFRRFFVSFLFLVYRFLVFFFWFLTLIFNFVLFFIFPFIFLNMQEFSEFMIFKIREHVLNHGHFFNSWTFQNPWTFYWFHEQLSNLNMFSSWRFFTNLWSIFWIHDYLIK